MPAELLTIPDIVVGSVVGGDLVLRNVVVSTDSQLPASGDTQKIQGSLDQFVSDLKVPTDLPSDVVVILIDSKTNSIIKASPSESEDFIADDAYFIGAFDRATADAVVADMINNPIPSNEYLAGKFFDSAVKLGVTSYVVGVEIFRAMQTSKKNYNNFITLQDRIMNPPASLLVSSATSIFPLKLFITAHQLDPNLSPESMEEVSGEIGALFPNFDTQGFSIVASSNSEFTVVGTVASASELQGILTRLADVNNQLATKFPSGIITVIPETVNVQSPIVYEGDEPLLDSCANARCIRVYKPCLEGYIDADPCCPNTGNCIPDPNYVNANQPAVQSPLAQEYVNLNQTIADLQASGEDIIYNKEIPFTQEELVVLLDAGDATIQTDSDGQQTIIANNDVRKYEIDVNPKYQQAVAQRDSIGSQLGVPAGCQPAQPYILPPSQVPAGCVPNPPPFDPSNPPFDPKTPPNPTEGWELTPSGWKLDMNKFCGGKKPCILVARIEGGKKGTYTPKPRPFPTGSDYDDRPQLDHWDANGNMIDQYGNRM